MGKLLICFITSHLIFVSSPSQSAVNSSPLFGAAIVTKFLTGNLVEHVSTIYLPIRAPYESPTMLNSLWPKMGWSFILSHASFAWFITDEKIEVKSPFPISIHSAYPPVP